MPTVTPGKTFTSNEIVTPTNLNQLGVPTVSNIVTADLADASVTTAKIADSNVTTAKIADSNVTTAKIANGAVTNAKLGNDIILVPAGAIMPFAMSAAPSGWLAADGTEYSKTGIYAALFAAIGTAHGETNGSGGAGTSHFRVPDLRGIFIRGASSQTISGITYSGTFGAKQQDAMQGHRHLQTTRAVSQNNGNNYTGIPLGNADTVNGANTGPPISDGTNGTPRTAAETRPANIALLYCIKF